MKALIMVDIQNDFMPFGALPVADGDAVVEVTNALASLVPFVVATQDWHPADHRSFASEHYGKAPGEVVRLSGLDQVLWPDHCVQGTPGASFHSALDVARIDAVVRKGLDREIDSYSGFYDNGHLRDTGMATLLRSKGVTEVWVTGLATDYCVKYTALDAVEQGFDVVVVEDAVRGVELTPGDIAAAFEEMRRAGCVIARSSDLPRS